MSVQESCMFCEESSVTLYADMITEALHDRYSTSHNERYLSAIEDIVDEEYTEEAARFREFYIMDDEDEFLSRQYRLDEWGRKVAMLGDYYGHHQDVPLFFGLPVSVSYYKYHDKRKQYEYKLLKRNMGQDVQSLSSVRDSEDSRKPNGTQLGHVLKDLTVDRAVDESRAFNEVCGRLGDLVKTKGKKIKKLMGLPIHHKHSIEREGFDVYLREYANKNNPKRRLSRKNMISGDKEYNVPMYAFRKLQKPKNTSNEAGFKGSMQSTMSKKNVSSGNKNIQVQGQTHLGQNRDIRTIDIRPSIKKMESINGLRFRIFNQKQSINEIYGAGGKGKNPTNHQTLSRTSLVDYKRRVSNNRAQSVARGTQRNPSVTLKARSNSTNALKYVPTTGQRRTTPDRRQSPSRKLLGASGGGVISSSCNLKRRPSPNRSKITSQVSIQKFEAGPNEETKHRVDKLLHQKLMLTVNPHSLYERLRRGR